MMQMSSWCLSVFFIDIEFLMVCSPTCSLTCSLTCPSTCSLTCSLACPSTCSLTCSLTCFPTCFSACFSSCNISDYNRGKKGRREHVLRELAAGSFRRHGGQTCVPSMSKMISGAFLSFSAGMVILHISPGVRARKRFRIRILLF